MSDTKGKVIKSKAAVLWEFNKPQTIEEIDVSPPKGKDVRIKILFTGVCHSDVHGWKGNMPFRRLPMVLGHEGTGIVESVGDRVTLVKEGDYVLVYCMPNCRECTLCQSKDHNFCIKRLYRPEDAGVMEDGTTRLHHKGKPLYCFINCGTYSEYTVIDQAYLTKIPKDAPMDKACLLSCGVSTGYGTVVNKAKVKPGSTCVVFGLGTVGLAAAMGCKSQGATRVIGIDINSGKKEIAKTFGVTEFYNPMEEDKPIDVLLTEKTQGGCDYAFECIGNTSVLESAIKSCRIGTGVCVVVGVSPPGKTANVAPFLFLFGRTLKGCFMGHTRVSQVPELLDEYKKKKILLDEFITGTCAIDDVNDAFENIGKGNSVKTMMYF